MFEYFKLKVSHFKGNEKLCVLVLDEMAITAANVYNQEILR